MICSEKSLIRVASYCHCEPPLMRRGNLIFNTFYFYSKQYCRSSLFHSSTADKVPMIPDDNCGKSTAWSRISSRATHRLNYRGTDIRADNRRFQKKSFYHPPKQDGGARSFPECHACFRYASGQNLLFPRKRLNQQNNTCHIEGRKAAHS
jgi:hypothetical protein